jgi:hypothetical protein
MIAQYKKRAVHKIYSISVRGLKVYGKGHAKDMFLCCISTAAAVMVPPPV